MPREAALLQSVAPESPPDEADVLIAGKPIVGMLLDDVEDVFDQLRRNDSNAVRPLNLTTETTAHRRWPGRGLRHFLREDEGEGYWDFFKPADHMTLSITDATYRTNAWVRVEGTGFFKLRILLSGELRTQTSALIIQGPSGMLYISPGACREGYFIAGGQPIRMVVLHCRRELLTHLLGLAPDDVPPPMNVLFSDASRGARHRIPLGPDIVHCAQRLIESRYQLSRTLRAAYLEALSIEMLTRVLSELTTKQMLSRSMSSLRARDLHCLYEARDYLTQHYSKPPRISNLARMVGINQTKLKAGFRQVIGKTIYEYVLQCRMEQACKLLLTGDFSVSEIAYRVGYEYPANFTAAFKRVYGRLPSCWLKTKAPC